jgi:hypothetical protein
VSEERKTNSSIAPHLASLGRFVHGCSTLAAPSIKRMSMSSELGWTAQLMSLMSEPFALCCSPRAKLHAQTEGTPEERSAIAEFFLGAEPAKLKATGSPGSDTDSAHSGSETDSEAQAHAASALVPPAPGRQVETAEARAELKYLAALLVSKKVDPDATQELCVYAQSFDGPSACIQLLTAELVGVGRPPKRSLLPDAFAVVQELMGRLTLDAMQRESSDELSVLVALSHAIIKAPLEECEECEPECQECEEEEQEEDPWLTRRTTTGRAPAIKTAAARSWIGQWTAGAADTLSSSKAVRFDFGREHSMPE